jgi:hypothetical protein
MHKTTINGEAGYALCTSISIRRNCEQPFRVLAPIHFLAASKTWSNRSALTPVYYRDTLASLSHFCNFAPSQQPPTPCYPLLPVEAGDGKALASTYICSFADDSFTQCLFPTTETADRIWDVTSRYPRNFGYPAISHIVSYSNWNVPAIILQDLIHANMVREPIIPNPGGACY